MVPCATALRVWGHCLSLVPGILLSLDLKTFLVETWGLCLELNSGLGFCGIRDKVTSPLSGGIWDNGIGLRVWGLGDAAFSFLFCVCLCREVELGVQQVPRLGAKCSQALSSPSALPVRTLCIPFPWSGTAPLAQACRPVDSEARPVGPSPCALSPLLGARLGGRVENCGAQGRAAPGLLELSVEHRRHFLPPQRAAGGSLSWLTMQMPS